MDTVAPMRTVTLGYQSEEDLLLLLQLARRIGITPLEISPQNPVSEETWTFSAIDAPVKEWDALTAEDLAPTEEDLVWVNA